jgi:tRNA-2-methylthio-N6-dimethylallyladenosine synthase
VARGRGGDLMRTYYLRSFGCQMNEHDAERIRYALEDEGLTAVETPGEADVLVYNTCTVRRSADDRLAGHLGEAARLKREDRSRIVLVTGCLPQAEQQGFFARFPFVDGALGPQNLHRLPELLREAVEPAGVAGGPYPRPGFFADGPRLSGALPGRRTRPFQAWVQVMSGCTNFCAYCIVPRVRGPERSRAAGEIVAEVQGLARDGVREVTLLGQNVNAYGVDLRGAGPGDGLDFAALLRLLDKSGGVPRLRFMTSHPKDLSDDLIATIAACASVCEHVHLALQSGSDRILAAMNRSYTAATFLERAAALRAAIPDVSLTTDLIAGFPGESAEDFAATLEVARAARFDGAFTFVYSPREGTAAARFPGQVPDDVRRARVGQLIALTQELALAARRRWVGRRAEVLVEGPSRRGGGWRGRTRQNVTVNVDGAAEPGAIVEVEIEAATSTTLRGRPARG